MEEPISECQADSIRTEMLVAATLFCSAPLMTQTDETQTPKALLLCCPVPLVCSLCAEQVLCYGCSLVRSLRDLCGGCVPCAVPCKKTPSTSLKHVNFTENRQASVLS